MILQYFKDCKNEEEAKTTYRKLVMQHHPDRGGNSVVFIAVKSEYDYILKRGFSTSTQETSGNAIWDDFWNQMQNAAVWEKQQRKEAERRTYQAHQEYRRNAYESDFAQQAKRAEQQRIKNYFDVKANNDVNYSVIDGIIAEGTQRDQNAKWMLMETYKLDGLDLDHFKYIQWKLNLKKGWCADAYKTYIQSNNIQWRD